MKDVAFMRRACNLRGRKEIAALEDGRWCLVETCITRTFVVFDVRKMDKKKKTAFLVPIVEAIENVVCLLTTYVVDVNLR